MSGDPFLNLERVTAGPSGWIFKRSAYLISGISPAYSPPQVKTILPSISLKNPKRVYGICKLTGFTVTDVNIESRPLICV